ncbi:MAG: hypothetical protein NTV01_01390 [Bacteroidia bacterium]|nr:hypothetical protein [Bacteroidia bacterium]
MKLDIKIPIGLLFTIFGLILSVYGLVTGSNTEIYAKSLGYNINLYIGLFMLVFGVFMLILSRKNLKEIK